MSQHPASKRPSSSGVGTASFAPYKKNDPYVLLNTDLVGQVRYPSVMLTFSSLVEILAGMIRDNPAIDHAALLPLLKVLPKQSAITFEAKQSYYYKTGRNTCVVMAKQHEGEAQDLSQILTSIAERLPDVDFNESRAFIYSARDDAFVDSKASTRNSRKKLPDDAVTLKQFIS